MTPLRAGVALFLVGGLLIVVVALRVATMQAEAEGQRHVTVVVDQRRVIWQLQTEMARARDPERIRDRVQSLGVSAAAHYDSLIKSPGITEDGAFCRR